MKTSFKTRTIFFIALAITVLDFVFMALTSEMAYLTVDDGTIQTTLSGYSTGEPFPVQQYLNVVITFPIAGLYRLFPGVQWWYVWSMALVATGIFLVHFCLLKLGTKNRVFLPVVFGIIIFLDIGFFLYPIANIAFTIVPAILGAGIVACLFLRAEAESVRHEKLFFVLSLVGYVLVFCHRRQSGLVLLCFILLAFLYYYVSRNTNWKKTLLKMALTVAVFVVATVSLTAVNQTVQNHYQTEEFRSFNSARSAYIDYPHDTYDENPALYESVGWDRDVYALVNNWCFLEKEVTAENLRYLSENSEVTTAETTWKEVAKEVYHDDLSRSVLMLYLASILIALFVLIVCRGKKNLVFWLLNNAGAISLIAYQIFTGRAPYRSLMVVLIPAVVINLMLSMNQRMEKKAVRVVFSLFVLAMGVICVSPMLQTTFNASRKAYAAERKEQRQLVCKYMTDRPDNFYITEVGVISNIDPTMPSGGTYNAFGWGGGTMYSAAYYKLLEVNGLSELTCDTLKEERIYFIARENVLEDAYYDNGKDLFAMFLRYLENHCGALGFVMEDTITDGAYAYHFVFEENEENYDTYYDIVDGYTVEVE